MNPENMSAEESEKAQRDNCVFCKIIAGEIPSNKVYEDENHLAILDINPANEGHVILLPKKHYQIMPQMPEEELSKMFATSKKLSKALLQTYQTGGTSIFVANGGVAGQRAPHFLIHIVPRKKDDGLFNIPKKEGKNLSQIQEKLIMHLSKMFGRSVVEKTQMNKEVEPEIITQPKIAPPPEKEVINENTNLESPEPKKDDKRGDADLDNISNLFLK